ncbi:MAG: hypothetical protein R2708_09160 [Vicinamibacterales bacterium]
MNGAPSAERGLTAQWTSAWARVLGERRTGSGRLGVAGAYVGFVAGVVFGPTIFFIAELIGPSSSTSVLALVVMPVLMVLLGVVGACALGVIAAIVGLLPGIGTAGARLPAEESTIRRAGWLGCVLGVLVAAINFYAESGLAN